MQREMQDIFQAEAEDGESRGWSTAGKTLDFLDSVCANGLGRVCRLDK